MGPPACRAGAARYCTATARNALHYQGCRRAGTVPVVDGEPGAESQIDFTRMRMLLDPANGRRRVAYALIFTAIASTGVRSREAQAMLSAPTVRYAALVYAEVEVARGDYHVQLAKAL